MRPIEIKHAIELAGTTQAEIARKSNVSLTMVNRVIWRSEVSDRIRREIAKTIGHDVTEIWPDYYAKKAVNQ